MLNIFESKKFSSKSPIFDYVIHLLYLTLLFALHSLPQPNPRYSQKGIHGSDIIKMRLRTMSTKPQTHAVRCMGGFYDDYSTVW